MITSGRTQPQHDGLRVETLIVAVPRVPSAYLRFEQRRIVELCQLPCSVAEIAAALRMPLGVARVLIADLLTDDWVQCESTSTDVPIPVLERLLAGIRAL
jgi:hypothetical protein